MKTKYLAYDLTDMTYSITDNSELIEGILRFPNEDLIVANVTDWTSEELEYFSNISYSEQINMVQRQEDFDEIKMNLERNPL